MIDRAAVRRATARLIVTADDVGLRADWDEAVADGLARGRVSSVSLVTTGAGYPAARRWIAEAPALDHGIHLNLYEGEPLSSARRVPSLVDDSGRFLGSVAGVVSRYLAGGLRPDEVEEEWERQVRRALEDGLAPTHLNSHYHLHMLPPLFEVVIKLARRFGIRFVRVVDEPPWLSPLRAGRLGLTLGLWLLSRGRRKRLRALGLDATACRGVGAGEKLSAREWQRLLRHLPPGVTELVCHPGQSVEQAEALSSRAVDEEVRRRARLVSFRDLVEARA